MTTEVIDIEPTQTQALAVRSQDTAVGILRPADSLDRIAEAFKEYQQVCERILTPDDYQAYEGKPRKKKSAWRKLATAFNVSTHVVKEELERDDNRRILSASFTICAYIGPKDRPYRQFEAVGYCDINEKCCPNARGEDCHKRTWKGHFCCKDGCDGRKHWTHPDHDVRSTAQTRASNRAIADLIGCGEVSAEELSDEGTNPQKGPNAQHRGTGGGKNVVKPSQTHPKGQGGMSTPPGNRTPQAGGKAAQGNAPGNQTQPQSGSGTTRAPQQAVFADSQTRERMIMMFSEALPLLHEFFVKAGCLLETEKLEELPLRFVPVTRRQAQQLESAVAGFGNGEQAGLPYPPNPEPEPVKKAPQPDMSPKASAVVDKAKRDPEWFFKIVCPIPHKSEKRDAYLKHPDTIESLYQAMKAGDQEAQKRLWGFAKHWTPTERQGTNGRVWPISQEDQLFREALDAFCEWHDKHANDTRGEEAQQEFQGVEEEDDVPF